MADWLTRVRGQGSHAALELAVLVHLAGRHALHAAWAHAVVDGVVVLRTQAVRAQASVEILLREEIVAVLAVPVTSALIADALEELALAHLRGGGREVTMVSW